MQVRDTPDPARLHHIVVVSLNISLNVSCSAHRAYTSCYLKMLSSPQVHPINDVWDYMAERCRARLSGRGRLRLTHLPKAEGELYNWNSLLLRRNYFTSWAETSM